MNPIEFIKAKNQHIERLSNQSGASGETIVLEKMPNWLRRPRGIGLKILLAALREDGIEIKGSSFDVIALQNEDKIDFTDAELVKSRLSEMIFIEIKTTTQRRVKEDFSGFFFALTENEITAADVLGGRHKVALYNKLTDKLLITSVSEILTRKKSSSWQLSIQL